MLNSSDLFNVLSPLATVKFSFNSKPTCFLFQARGKSTDAGHLAQKTQQVRDKTPTVAQKNALNKNKESQKTAVKSVPTAQKGQNKGGKPAATPPHKLPPQVTAAPPPPRPATQKNPKKKHTPQDLVVTINLVSALWSNIEYLVVVLECLRSLV